MLSNYLKIAWRNMLRHKIYTIINVLGLALGISACIVIFLIANYELSFDRFHPDKDRIYRVTSELQDPSGQKYYWKTVPPATAAAINEEMSPPLLVFTDGLRVATPTSSWCLYFRPGIS